ncbi:MAG: cytochrome P450 [Myxococcota bacterium]
MLERVRPPGPPQQLLLGSFRDFARDPTGFLLRNARTYGDLIHYHIGPMYVYQVNHPDLIAEVLLHKKQSFMKERMTREMSLFLGSGLVTSEGGLWKRQRKTIAPVLKYKQIAHYANVMVALSQRFASQLGDGEHRDIHSDIMKVTLSIVAQTLFETEVAEDGERIGYALIDLLNTYEQLLTTWRRFVPKQVPLALRRRIQRATAELDAVIFDLIESKRQAGCTGDDLLSRLMMARDEDGQPMSDRQVRDEIATMFLAGHETSALGLSYAIHLLCEHPEAYARVENEIATVIGDRPATAADFAELPFTTAVFREAMRLYPPVWAFGRTATEDCEVGGYPVRKGWQITISQYSMHRDSRWFDKPDGFHPERWLDGLDKRLPRFVYLPFGGGPRICIGNHFAMMMSVLVLATITQRVRFASRPGHPLVLQPTVSLRPKHGVHVSTEVRSLPS